MKLDTGNADPTNFASQEIAPLFGLDPATRDRQVDTAGAMRAAFFIRHNTANRLARSYAPHGEAVAPQIEVGFEARGEDWQVNKRFLKGASVEVRGPNGRAQGEDAETQLQALLGARRDTSQAGDAAAHGVLGLLWVGQAQALEVTAPGDIVRDSVRATLETEVGTIMGGAAYQRVRPRIDSQFADYWTTTGRPSGRQTTARTEHDAAESAATEAATRLAALEQGFSDLEAARAKLKVPDRDLADTTDTERRKVVVGQIDMARSAAELRDTRRAEQGRLADQVRGLGSGWLGGDRVIGRAAICDLLKKGRSFQRRRTAETHYPFAQQSAHASVG